MNEPDLHTGGVWGGEFVPCRLRPVIGYGGVWRALAGVFVFTLLTLGCLLIGGSLGFLVWGLSHAREPDEGYGVLCLTFGGLFALLGWQFLAVLLGFDKIRLLRAACLSGIGGGPIPPEDAGVPVRPLPPAPALNAHARREE